MIFQWIKRGDKMFNIHKDYKILKPIRKWIVNRAFVKIVLDVNKLDEDNLFILSNVVIAQMNRNSNEYRYSISIDKVNK